MSELPGVPTRPMCSANPLPPATAAAAKSMPVAAIVTQPPMAVRAALVGTSIGFGEYPLRIRHMRLV